MFIVMANFLNIIQFVLLDCMEIIQVSGYFIEEKIEIVKCYFIFEQCKEYGLKVNQVKLGKCILEVFIEIYICEFGVWFFNCQIVGVMCNVA